MITLFTIFHIFLFPVQESGKTTCQDKLERLNYTYYIPLFYEDSLKATEEHIQEIKRTLNCFEQAAKQDTGKVLLITLHTTRSSPRYSYRRFHFGIEEVLKLYNLPLDESFFTTRFIQDIHHKKSELPKDSFRIELISNSSKRLCLTRNGNYKYHYSCTPSF